MKSFSHENSISQVITGSFSPNIEIEVLPCCKILVILGGRMKTFCLLLFKKKCFFLGGGAY